MSTTKISSEKRVGVEITKYYKIQHYPKLKSTLTQSLKTANIVECQLCPNRCIIKDGKTSICGIRKNITGKFYNIAYAKPCAIHIDPIEKKPLYHFYPGQKILSIGTFGCNLACRGCQNFDISKIKNDEIETRLKNMIEYSPEKIIAIAKRDGVKMIAYTYNEPTVFFEYMLDIAKLARKEGIKNIIVSNGYINLEPLKELCKYIDAANIDLKGIRPQFYKEYTCADIRPVLKTIKYLHKKGIWLELTNLLIPKFNNSKEEIKKLCSWIKTNLGTDVPIHFSRFYPYYRAKTIQITPSEDLTNAKEIAESFKLKYVYLGNLGYLENTTCYKCGATLVDRAEYPIHTHGIINRKCKQCGAEIRGFF